MDPVVILLAAGVGYLLLRKPSTDVPVVPPGSSSSGAIGLAPKTAATIKTRTQRLTALAPISKVTQDPAPDLTKFSPLLWRSHVGQNAHAGDVRIAVMDYSPELGGDSPAGVVYEAYMAHVTAVRPTGIQITNLSVDKAVGGTDRAAYTYPDGRRRSRVRDRGQEWPSEWAGKVMWVNWHDFPGTSLNALGTLAEGVTGKEMPYIVCKARLRRKPARKQVEIIRLAKMDRPFRDIGQAFILPAVAMVTEWVGGKISGAFAGLPAHVATTVANTMTNTIKYAASGNLDSWRDGVRILKSSVSARDIQAFSARLQSSTGSKAVTAITNSLKAVKNPSYITEAVASLAGVRMGSIAERNRMAELGGSPSRIANVTVYT